MNITERSEAQVEHAFLYSAIVQTWGQWSLVRLMTSILSATGVPGRVVPMKRGTSICEDCSVGWNEFGDVIVSALETWGCLKSSDYVSYVSPFHFTFSLSCPYQYGYVGIIFIYLHGNIFIYFPVIFLCSFSINLLILLCLFPFCFYP